MEGQRVIRSMETTNRQFGLIVAYLLPGFIALGGFALLMPEVADWLQPVEGESGIAPSVYTVMAATALGMILSCFRWLLIDHVFAWTGITPPEWEFERLEQRLPAFDYFVEYHYRYYQFYANTFIAVLWTYALNRWLGTSAFLGVVTDAAVLLFSAALLAGARDALRKYYQRTNRLLSAPER
jgi:hypothetical protein